MTTNLQVLREILVEFAPSLDFASLIGQIDGDLVCMRSPVVTLAAPDAATVSVLRQAVCAVCPGCVADDLPPYLRLPDWDPNTPDRVSHASVLAVWGNARQFLPAVLFRLLAMADSNALPVVFLVEGMGKMRDPKTHDAALRQQLVRELPRNTPRLAFLTGGRFEGEALESVLDSFLTQVTANAEIEARRERRLFHLRISAARTIVQTEKRRLRLLRNQSAADQSDMEETRRTLLATGGSVAACWSNESWDLIHDIDSRNDQCASAMVIGDPALDILHLRASWHQTMHLAVETKVVAYLSTVQYRLGTLPAISSQSLSRQLAKTIDDASGKMGEACEHAGTAIRQSLGLRDSRAQVAQTTNSAIGASGQPLDPDSASADDGDAASGDDVSFGGLLGAIGLATKQALNFSARKDISNAISSLIGQLGQIRDQASRVVEDQIAKWVNGMIAGVRADSDASEAALRETELRAAAVDACLARLEEK